MNMLLSKPLILAGNLTSLSCRLSLPLLSGFRGWLVNSLVVLDLSLLSTRVVVLRLVSLLKRVLVRLPM